MEVGFRQDRAFNGMDILLVTNTLEPLIVAAVEQANAVQGEARWRQGREAAVE